MKKQIIVLDFDGVINNQWNDNTLYPQIIEIINYLIKNEFIVCIATRRNDEQANQMYKILKENNIYDMFECIEIGAMSKIHHLNAIKDKLINDNIEFTELILFDDYDINIIDVQSAGFTGVLVDNKSGLQYHHIQSIISN